MIMPDEWYEEYKAVVRRTSYSFAKSYRGFVYQDDVEQECWMWFCTHVNKVRSWKSENGDDPKAVDRLVGRSLRNAALDYCLREKMKAIGADLSDLFWYTPDFVKLMLPGAIANDWKRVQDLSSAYAAGKDLAEKGDWMAYASDIQKAFGALSDADKAFVYAMYVKDSGIAAFSSEDSDGRAAAMAANRAVKKMVKFLGGSKPFTDREIEEVEDEGSEEV